MERCWPLSFVMLLAVLLLERRLYTLEKKLTDPDTSTQDTRSQGTQSQTPVTGLQCHQASIQNLLSGHSHGPHQVVKRQWMLLGLYLL